MSRIASAFAYPPRRAANADLRDRWQLWPELDRTATIGAVAKLIVWQPGRMVEIEPHTDREFGMECPARPTIFRPTLRAASEHNRHGNRADVLPGLPFDQREIIRIGTPRIRMVDKQIEIRLLAVTPRRSAQSGKRISSHWILCAIRTDPWYHRACQLARRKSHESQACEIYAGCCRTNCRNSNTG